MGLFILWSSLVGPMSMIKVYLQYIWRMSPVIAFLNNRKSIKTVKMPFYRLGRSYGKLLKKISLVNGALAPNTFLSGVTSSFGLETGDEVCSTLTPPYPFYLSVLNFPDQKILSISFYTWYVNANVDKIFFSKGSNRKWAYYFDLLKFSTRFFKRSASPQRTEDFMEAVSKNFSSLAKSSGLIEFFCGSSSKTFQSAFQDTLFHEKMRKFMEYLRRKSLPLTYDNISEICFSAPIICFS